MSVSVIVPVYKGGKAFRLCLDGLARAAPPPHEVIVVADGEGDGSWRLAAESGYTVKRLDSRRGASAARNLGARSAEGDILFFVDADVAVPSDIIGRLTAAFADPAVSATIGSYDSRPGSPDFLSQYRNLLHHWVHQTSNPEAATFWGACGAIRRSAFMAVGGYDENCLNLEDIELGYRLTRAGHRIRLDASLQVTHHKTWTAALMVYTDFWKRGVAWTLLSLKSGIFLNDLNLRFSGRISVAAACLMPLLLVLAPKWPIASAGAVLAMVTLIFLNHPFYRFLKRRRGTLFLLAALPWHWLYFFLGGSAFAAGLAIHMLGGWRPLTDGRPLRQFASEVP